MDRPGGLSYQTRQAWGLTIGCPALHEKALANSGMLLTTPLMRYSSGECGLVMALARLLSGRSSPQSHCAKPIKQGFFRGWVRRRFRLALEPPQLFHVAPPRLPALGLKIALHRI